MKTKHQHEDTTPTLESPNAFALTDGQLDAITGGYSTWLDSERGIAYMDVNYIKDARTNPGVSQELRNDMMSLREEGYAKFGVWDPAAKQYIGTFNQGFPG
jgi:hypothetical protein